jgi:lysozyme family protein
MSFLYALSHVLKHEGGYVNHPSDPGGATNFGITRDTLAEWRDRHVTIEEVKDLSKDEAAEIYKYKYWDAAKCGKMPAGVALIVFDGAVNHGVSQSSKFLQRALGVDADGKVGSKTLAAIEEIDAVDLIVEIASQRMRFYGRLSTFTTFGLGWSRRLMDTLRVAVFAQGAAR